MPRKAAWKKKKGKKKKAGAWKRRAGRARKLGAAVSPFMPLVAVMTAYICLSALMWRTARVNAAQRIKSVLLLADGSPMKKETTSIGLAREEELRGICRKAVDRSGLAPGLCAELADALEASPWVSEVHSVTRRGLNRIVADISPREPLAVLAAAGDECLVSNDCTRLPWDVLNYRPEGMPRIYVEDSMMPAHPGDAVLEAPVREAVEIIDNIRVFSLERNLRFKVTGARLRKTGAFFNLVVFTNLYEISINWGAVEEIAEEPSRSEKLELLEKRLRENQPRLAHIKSIIVRDRRAPVTLKSLEERAGRYAR